MTSGAINLEELIVSLRDPQERLGDDRRIMRFVMAIGEVSETMIFFAVQTGISARSFVDMLSRKYPSTIMDRIVKHEREEFQELAVLLIEERMREVKGYHPKQILSCALEEGHSSLLSEIDKFLRGT